MTRDRRWDAQEVFEALGPVLALEHSIRRATRMVPTAVMLPLSLLPGLDEVKGLPVVRGDRTALLYEPRSFA
jgi:hypothetical protein